VIGWPRRWPAPQRITRPNDETPRPLERFTGPSVILILAGLDEEKTTGRAAL
jgi:hypothetical protein